MISSAMSPECPGAASVRIGPDVLPCCVPSKERLDRLCSQAKSGNTSPAKEHLQRFGNGSSIPGGIRPLVVRLSSVLVRVLWMDVDSQITILSTLVPANLEHAPSLTEMEVSQQNFFLAWSFRPVVLETRSCLPLDFDGFRQHLHPAHTEATFTVILPVCQSHQQGRMAGRCNILPNRRSRWIAKRATGCSLTMPASHE